MAIFARVQLDNASVVSGQKVNVALVLLNTGTAAVTVNSIESNPNAGQSAALPNLPPNPVGGSNSIPAAVGAVPGQLVYAWTENFNAAVQPTQTQTSFNVGATVYTSDGSVTASNVATVAVTPMQPSTQSPGQFPFTPVAGPPSVSAITLPLPGAFPNMPVAGQLRFDSNLNGALFPSTVL